MILKLKQRDFCLISSCRVWRVLLKCGEVASRRGEKGWSRNGKEEDWSFLAHRGCSYFHAAPIKLPTSMRHSKFLFSLPCCSKYLLPTSVRHSKFLFLLPLFTISHFTFWIFPPATALHTPETGSSPFLWHSYFTLFNPFVTLPHHISKGPFTQEKEGRQSYTWSNMYDLCAENSMSFSYLWRAKVGSNPWLLRMILPLECMDDITTTLLE